MAHDAVRAVAADQNGRPIRCEVQVAAADDLDSVVATRLVDTEEVALAHAVLGQAQPDLGVQ
jgi:hypothetical protein